MRIFRLAELFVLKYADTSSDQLETSIRKDIHILWKIPNELFNILRACAESSPKNAKNVLQVKAINGFKFCQKLLTMIDYLETNVDTISLIEIKKITNSIVEFIEYNIYLKFDSSGKPSEEGVKSELQFSHVSELIFEMIPATTKHTRVIRDQQFNKARTGLSRILSITLGIIEKISKLEMIVPEKFDSTAPIGMNKKLPFRFIPDRSTLSIYDIMDFIRQHGLEYGISTTEDWATVFENDLQLKNEITTVINAINRGHYPKGSIDIKMEITRILKEYEERKSSNNPFFESFKNEEI